MSMPVTGLDLRGRDNLPDLASVLGHIDTTGYLFGEEDKEHNPAASPDHKATRTTSSLFLSVVVMQVMVRASLPLPLRLI
jgi:hypothetical protein